MNDIDYDGIKKYKISFVIDHLCSQFGYSIPEALKVWQNSKTSKILEDDYWTNISAARLYEELLDELNGNSTWLMEPLY